MSVTHHLTAFALAAFFVSMAIAHRICSPRVLHGFHRRDGRPVRAVMRPRRGAPWGLAALAAGLAILWAIFVAPRTMDYLGDIFSRAFGGLSGTLLGDGTARAPFESNPGPGAPLWERGAGLGAAAVSAVLVLVGCLRLRGRWRRNPLALVFAAAGAAYLLLLPLRLVPEMWETANRSSDLLFIGVAYLSAATLVVLARVRRWGGVFVASITALLLVGGVVTGWPPDMRLASPYRVTSPEGHTLEPQGRELARWAAERLPPFGILGADESNGRFLLSHGRQSPLITRVASIDLLIGRPRFTSGQHEAMLEYRLHWIVMDRRIRANRNMSGYFFRNRGQDDFRSRPAVQDKWDRAGADRVYDTGDIVVYDTKRFLR